MEARGAADEVIAGLNTKADQIRALARAGYDRVEIARELGLRYSHVRHVLVRSGISGGLRRSVEVALEPVAIDTAPASRATTSGEVLLRAGFRLIGEWSGTAEGGIRLDAPPPATPGLYAFVLEDAIAYVGVSHSGLKERLDQYRRGHAGQRTSSRVKGLIAVALAAGQRVKVLVATPDAIE